MHSVTLSKEQWRLIFDAVVYQSTERGWPDYDIKLVGAVLRELNRQVLLAGNDAAVPEAPTTPARVRWEYRILDANLITRSPHLAQLGADGWEAVCLIQQGSGEMGLLLKREMAGSTHADDR